MGVSARLTLSNSSQTTLRHYIHCISSTAMTSRRTVCAQVRHAARNAHARALWQQQRERCQDGVVCTLPFFITLNLILTHLVIACRLRVILFACRCRSCSQIVTIDVLGDVAVWSLTGGGTITTSSNGEFIPPPLACTMTLPPICMREGQDSAPPALVELQRMFRFQQQSSSVRNIASNYYRF